MIEPLLERDTVVLDESFSVFGQQRTSLSGLNFKPQLNIMRQQKSMANQKKSNQLAPQTLTSNSNPVREQIYSIDTSRMNQKEISLIPANSFLRNSGGTRIQQPSNSLTAQPSDKEDLFILDDLQQYDDLAISSTQYLKQEQERKLNPLLRLIRKMPLIESENTFIICWDIFVWAVTIAYYFAIPFKIVFHNSLIDKHGPYGIDDVRGFYPNWATITSIFVYLMDIIFRFFRCFYESGIAIKNLEKIAHNYLTGLFSLDVLMLLVLTIEVLFIGELFPILMLVFYFKAVNLERIDKKMIRILQLHRRLKAVYLLLRLSVFLMLSTHSIACMFLFEALWAQQHYPDMPNWVQESKIFHGLINAPISLKYENALYWAVTTMISVGYGDITPTNQYEIGFTIVVMLISCAVFAYSVNMIWTIMESIKIGQQRFQRHVNAINRFMRYKKISKNLQLRIGAYLEYYWEAKQREKDLEKSVIDSLAPSLREELIFEANGYYFKQIPWLQRFSQEFLIELSNYIQEQKSSPEEIIYHEDEDKEQLDLDTDCDLFYVEIGEYELYYDLPEYQQGKGIALHSLKAGDYFGTYSFITGEPRETTCRSLGYGTLYRIPRKDFLDLISNYHDDYIDRVELARNNYRAVQDCRTVAKRRTKRSLAALEMLPSVEEAAKIYYEEMMDQMNTSSSEEEDDSDLADSDEDNDREDTQHRELQESNEDQQDQHRENYLFMNDGGPQVDSTIVSEPNQSQNLNTTEQLSPFQLVEGQEEQKRDIEHVDSICRSASLELKFPPATDYEMGTMSHSQNLQQTPNKNSVYSQQNLTSVQEEDEDLLGADSRIKQKTKLKESPASLYQGKNRSLKLQSQQAHIQQRGKMTDSQIKRSSSAYSVTDIAPAHTTGANQFIGTRGVSQDLFFGQGFQPRQQGIKRAKRPRKLTQDILSHSEAFAAQTAFNSKRTKTICAEDVQVQQQNLAPKTGQRPSLRKQSAELVLGLGVQQNRSKRQNSTLLSTNFQQSAGINALANLGNSSVQRENRSDTAGSQQQVRQLLSLIGLKAAELEQRTQNAEVPGEQYKRVNFNLDKMQDFEFYMVSTNPRRVVRNVKHEQNKKQRLMQRQQQLRNNQQKQQMASFLRDARESRAFRDSNQ